MTPTDVANLALAEIGNRVQISSFTDGSPAGNAAALFYTPKTQMLLRTANWDFARAGATPLTLWKQLLTSTGAISASPPPQPWQYSYLYPSDCLKVRFIQPTIQQVAPGTPLTTAPAPVYGAPPVPTAIPFVIGTDFDASGNPIKTVLCNVPYAQVVYTRDLSQYPDLWDALFLAGETALLGSYFINALARNAAQMNQQIAAAKAVIEQARAANANESISSIDHTPDWMRVRMMTAVPWAWNNLGPNGAYGGSWGGWDACGFPDGTFY